MIHVRDNITGRNYRRLVQFAFQHSDAALMVFQEHCGDNHWKQTLEIRDRLQPYLLKEESNECITPENPFFQWPGTRVAYCNPFNPPELFRAPEKAIYVCTYRLSEEVKEFILSVDGFFNWWPGKNPEDLAFFKDGKCWIYSTVHEHDLFFMDHQNEIREMLHKMRVRLWII